MKFLVDECCDVDMVARLRKAGYDVTYVLEIHQGFPDDDILAQAYKENRVLITEDKDFGELVYRLEKPARGILLLRIPIEQRSLKADRLERVLDKLGNKIMNNFVVVELETIRLRPLL